MKPATVRTVDIHGARFRMALNPERPLPPGWRIVSFNELLDEEHPVSYRTGDDMSEVARMAVERMRGR